MVNAQARGPGKAADRLRGPFLSALLGSLSLRMALSLALILGLGVMEAAGLCFLISVLGFVGLEVEASGLAWIVRLLSAALARIGASPELPALLAGYALISSLTALLQRAETLISLGLQHELVASLRERLHRAITHAGWLFFCRSRSSDFTHLLTAEVERAGAATYHLLRLLATSVLALVYLVFACGVSPAMTALVFTSGGALMLAVRGKTRLARAAGEGLSASMQGLYAAISDHLGGMKIVKSHGGEDHHADLFAGLNRGVRRQYLRAVRNQADVKCWFDIGSVVVLSLVVYVAVGILALPAAELCFLVYLFARILPRAGSIEQGYQSLLNLLPAFRSIQEMEARCRAAAEPRTRAREEIKLEEAIRLEGVTFAYEEVPVIRDLALTLRAGETAALVGRSGAGKSTAADLMAGLIAPQRGRVLVDGKPLTPERMRPWRERIGYVTQEVFLFHDTVRANLRWACPGASDDDLYRALRSAGAAELVSRLPRGLDTVLGDRGARLSWGERQRLALARALLRKPSLLILDEATSNLDPENEQWILRSVEELQGAMAILIISHRSPMVRGADVIHVLEGGRLVESGSWEELTGGREGGFRSLFQREAGPERLHPLVTPPEIQCKRDA